MTGPTAITHPAAVPADGIAAQPAPVELSARVLRFAALLENWERRTVRLPELLAIYAQADPSSAGRPERRADIADAIRTLADAGLLVPSKTLERTAVPALPTRVVLPAAEPSPTAAALARTAVWRPELAWAGTARLTVGQVHTLLAVNRWLRDRGRDTDVVPVRERSLELLGHEKALDRMLGTSLFGPGRLSLGLLRTYRAHPPLPATRVGPGPVLLVVENADTYTTLLTCARSCAHDVGWVAWGAGGAFEASVRSVRDLDPAIREVRYFGDLDFDGLRIPANAAAVAAAEGLPPVLPAYRLYEQLLQVGTAQTGQPVVAENAAEDAAAWLTGAGAGVELGSVVRALLTDGARIPQEALGARDLLGERALWSGC